MPGCKDPGHGNGLTEATRKQPKAQEIKIIMNIQTK